MELVCGSGSQRGEWELRVWVGVKGAGVGVNGAGVGVKGVSGS